MPPAAALAATVWLACGAAADQLPPPSHLRAGEYCSPDHESYYERYGYTCRPASDGRYRLFTQRGGGGSAQPPGHADSYATGPTVLFAARTRRSGCRLRDHGALPDRDCTPGAYYVGATRVKVCQPGWSEHVRKVSDATKDSVYREYGIASHHPGQYEIDHLVPLEDGGSNSIANLFPQAARPEPGFHQKDDLENLTHAQICARKRDLRATQREFARNWLLLYHAEIKGERRPPTSLVDAAPTRRSSLSPPDGRAAAPRPRT